MTVNLLKVIRRSKIPESYLIGSYILGETYQRVILSIYVSQYGEKLVKYRRVDMSSKEVRTYDTPFAEFFDKPIDRISGGGPSSLGNRPLVFEIWRGRHAWGG